MTDLTFLPIEIWEEIFRNWLGVLELVRLSGTSRHFNSIAHQISAYHIMPIYGKIPVVRDINQIKGWPNISFVKNIYLNNTNQTVSYHPAFQTWKFFPNVFFSINCWKFSKDIPSSHIDRIIHIDSGTLSLLEGKCPYLGFSNISCSTKHKPSKYVKRVHFRYCDNIDLNGYSHLEEIQIIHSDGIFDLTPITGVKSVTIKHQLGYLDISSLRFATKVDLSGCFGILDFKPLKNVKHLILDQTFVADISFIEKAEILSLASCKCLDNIDHLKNIKGLVSLNIDRCHMIKSLEPLRGLKCLKWVSVISCHLIDDVSMLGNLEYLNISCTQVENVSMLGNLETLIMRSTPVEDVSMLGRLKKLNISCCTKIFLR